MADVTFGVKVSEDLRDKVKNMIENSGASSKEWFEKAVALTEVQELKEGASDYKQDLSELEVHTTRIYELTANMIKRANFLKDNAVKEVAEQLEDTEEHYRELKNKLAAKDEELKVITVEHEAITKENEELHKLVEQLRSTNENNQSLIGEYKEKIDTLSGLVSEYKSYQDENKELQEKLSVQQQQYASQVNELTEDNKDKDESIRDLHRDIESLKHNHAIEVERLNEKKDFEREKALLEVAREHQDKLSEISLDHSKELKELYGSIDKLRSEYEAKIEKLQQTPAPANTPQKTPRKTNKGTNE